MRIGTSSNLESGGRFDILTIEHPEGFPTGGVKTALSKTPRRISGIQKVAQTFLRLLVTTSGSDVLHDIGTKFNELSTMSPGSPQMAGLIRDNISQAEAQTKAILNSPRADTASQLERVEVLAVNPIREGVDMKLRIITRAGEAAAIALPFTSAGIQVDR